MKNIYFLMVLLLLAIKVPAQTIVAFPGQYGPIKDGAQAPLLIFTNGGGTIFLSYPFHTGGMYRVGREYEAVAVPDWGYVFTGWNPVNVFTFTEVTLDAQGNANPPVTSMVLSPIPQNYTQPMISLFVEPDEVNYDVPGVDVITLGRGWQANFERRPGRWPGK